MNELQFFLNHNAGHLSDEITKYNGVFNNIEVINFHRSFPGYMPTPVYSLAGAAKTIGISKLFVKDEAERLGLKAFKVLGASYAMSKLAGPNDNVTFCTATDGNHGRAVAWAAAKMGKQAKIFVPRDTVEARISYIEREGAEVFVIDGDYDLTVKIARQQAEKNNWVLVQDSSWEGYTEIPKNIMAGYTTILKELEDGINTPGKPAVDIVVLQSGVGSWAASAVWYYYNRYNNNRPKIINVEPSEADCCLESMIQGKPSTTFGSQKTMMAGLNCGTPSHLAMDILKKGVDLFMTIPDRYSGHGMREFYFTDEDEPQIISGESGAAGIGGLIALAKEPAFAEAKEFIGLNAKSRVLVFNTEGNTDPVNFEHIIHGN